GCAVANGSTPQESVAAIRAYYSIANKAVTRIAPEGMANFNARDKNPATYPRGFGINENTNEAIPINSASAVEVCLGKAGYCHASSEKTRTNRNAYVVFVRNRCAKRSMFAITLRPSATT